MGNGWESANERKLWHRKVVMKGLYMCDPSLRFDPCARARTKLLLLLLLLHGEREFVEG